MKNFLKIILSLTIITLVYLNSALYYTPQFIQTGKTQYNADVYSQLQFLKRKLHHGAASEMQGLFPEGFVFINALYGLAWLNLISELDKNNDIHQAGIAEINWAIQQINAPEAKEIFNPNLPLKYGAFYRGWSNLLLGSKLKIQVAEDRNRLEIGRFKQNCHQIIQAIKESDTPYIESYRMQSWPADVVIAMASVAIYDNHFSPIFQEDIKKWMVKVKQKLDPKTGLIPHAVDARNGAKKESARGSSQSLILNFLITIDSTFAKQQFQIYQKLFLDSRMGLPGIREYPSGYSGRGDIDSGPVIFGIGGAASIVGQQTFGLYQNWETYQGLRNAIEAFGMGYTSHSEKKYIFGQLPMADAFIAWSNSIEKHRGQVAVKHNWRIKFHLLSIGTIALLSLLSYRFGIFKKSHRH